MPTQDEIKRLNRQTFRLGKLPAPVGGPPVVRLSDHLLAGPDALPAIPAKCDWARKIAQFSPLGNDKWGSCVASAIGNIVRTWTTVAGRPFAPTPNQALQYYSAISGFRRTLATDKGAYMIDGLNRWKNVGFAGHKIWGFARLDGTDPYELARAIYLFGPIDAGFLLPDYVAGFIGPGPEMMWDLMPLDNEASAPGSWGGHALMITGYDLTTQVFNAITWGRRQFIRFPFIARYCDEVYAALSRDWIAANGQSASHVNFMSLRQALSSI
jgi:hypothetical protein